MGVVQDYVNRSLEENVNLLPIMKILRKLSGNDQDKYALGRERNNSILVENTEYDETNYGQEKEEPLQYSPMTKY
jgi:hypothetical protein